MPEIVEVRLSAEIIKPLIQNQIIVDAFPSTTGRYKQIPPEGYQKFLDGISNGECRVQNIRIRGKFMYWEFSNNWYMFCSFGMTGQWHPEQGKHPCFIFHYAPTKEKITIYQQLVFNDPRHFGNISFTNNINDLTTKLANLGWEPFQEQFSDRWIFLSNRVLKSNKCISQLLMDQSIFCGVGNYIKCESLYQAKISPWRAGSSLTNAELELLCEMIVKVINESYQYQGATIQTYRGVYGVEGRYSSCFKVYGKLLDPQGNKVITQTTPDKRTTHWVPGIQK